MNGIFLVLAAFLASAIESVEMAAILIGVGETRGWRSTWLGALTGFALLAVVVIGMGTALKAVPIDRLRLIVGALLLIFGLQWLKKALLRLSGRKRKTQHEDVGTEPAITRDRMDWYAFVVAFKGVLLEGLEIAFIVVTFGAEARAIWLASMGAIAAFVVVTLIAFQVHPILAKIPREWLRFAVGILLTTFGTFWSGEGAGVHWPGSDGALLVLLALLTGLSFLLLRTLSRGVAATVEVAR